MSVSVALRTQLTVTETLETNVPDVQAANAKVIHDQFNLSETLSSTSTPPATKVASFQKALSSGAATIDLTALTGTNGATVDFTGLKVNAAKFRNPSTNANAITVTFGASSGYLLGGAAWKWILLPGDEVTVRKYDGGPDVDGTHKNIDLAGTASQALDVILIAG